MKIASVTAKIAEKSTSEKLEYEMNWYDLPGALDGFENNPEFIEKMAIPIGRPGSLALRLIMKEGSLTLK